MTRLGPAVFVLAALAVSPVAGDITVRGFVLYWNGDITIGDGNYGRYLPAKRTAVHVECDKWWVGDQDVCTSDYGEYQVTFKQKWYRPDFSSLGVNVEVRATVFMKPPSDPPEGSYQISCFKSGGTFWLGCLRFYPYNGQTDSVTIPDGRTYMINVYVDGPGAPAPPGAARPNTSNLRLTSWDYDDGDGSSTATALFLCHTALEVYEYLVPKVARESDLKRAISLYYPEPSTAYQDTKSPPGTAWIDVTHRNLFGASPTPIDRWQRWRSLRCSVLHETSHKTMHDMYWTMPRTSPWEGHEHDLSTCQSGEMGWREGWADFLPAAIVGVPTLEGNPTSYANGFYGKNIEHSWYPDYQDPNLYPIDTIPGGLAWRDGITGRRDWNEGEVAAVLWDIFDPVGWENMPKALQDAKPAGWPGRLRWYDRFADPNLQFLWKYIVKEVDCLNDEEDFEVNWDSLWTEFLKETPAADERIHALKAIMYNRGITTRLRPQNAPQIVSVKMLGRTGSLSLAQLTVKEPDAEDRPYLFYNVAYAREGHPMRLANRVDLPLQGVWSGDQATAAIVLPPRDRWDKLTILVHDSMTPAYSSQDANSMSAGADSPAIQMIAAGGHRWAAWRSDGTVWSAGESPRGTLEDSGMGISAAEWKIRRDTPLPVQGLADVLALAVGSQHSVALGRDGTVWTWGDNYSGCLGVGNNKPVVTTPRTTVSQITAAGSDNVAVAAGLNTTLVLKKDMTVWAWGNNGHGQLGGGTTADCLVPAHAKGLEKIKAISASVTHSMALDANGLVWTLGWNEGNNVGNAKADGNVPAMVKGLDGVAAIAAGAWYAMALREDGTVWEWGKCGRMVADYRLTPWRVDGLEDIVAIASGDSHHLALAADGRVWSWGECGAALGDGTGKSRWKAEPVKDLTNVIAIAAGITHSMALRSDGTVWTWGLNTSNVLGSGLRPGSSNVPIQVQTYKRIAPRKPTETADSFALEPLRLFAR